MVVKVGKRTSRNILLAYGCLHTVHYLKEIESRLSDGEDAVKEDNKMTDRENLCKEFCELTGGHWHELKHLSGYEYVCNCGAAFNVFDPRCVEMTISQHNSKNPTYTNPTDVLGVMMDRLDWRLFQPKIGVVYDDGQFMIAFGYVMEPDALLKAAVDFLKEGKK
jgi:hypothetical protein